MIKLKTSAQIAAMKEAGRITGEALLIARDMVRPGISTYEIDAAIRHYIEKCGAKPAFLGYGGFPASACISVNNEVIHGIPGGRVLEEGDIVKVDVGAYIGGFHGDSARTFPVGKISDEAQRLIDVTRESFFEGIKYAKEGNYLFEISAAIGRYAEKFGYGVVRDLCGHGIGMNLHESPEIPNYVMNRRGVKLKAGMTLAIEPMINMGSWKVDWLDDEWTVVTRDHSLSAHYENTVLITKDGPKILSMTESI
jgi:methionyl aminopeptidase